MKLVNNCINVNVYGNKENLPVIFIHGFPFSQEMWKFQIDELKEDYFVITYDVRGLGKSYVGDGQYTMEAYVSDLLALINEMGLEKVVLCGLSMGGYIALRAAEKEPGLIKALILCDTKDEADKDFAKLIRADSIDKINVEGLRAFVELFLPNCVASTTIKNNPELYEWLISIASNHNPTGVKGAQLAMLSRTSTTKALKKFDFPVLLVCGSKDNLTPPEVMEKMAEKIPNAKLKKISKSGHLPPLENPEMFNKALKGFLSKLK